MGVSKSLIIFSLGFLCINLAQANFYNGHNNFWNRYNCADGNVTDFICCHDNHCDDIHDKNSCNQEKTCSWSGDKCSLNRDRKNQVCCPTPVDNRCSAIVEGICPIDHQVPAECCSERMSSYSRFLLIDKPGYVCCNTPCEEARKNKNCKVADSCPSPFSGRSLSSYGNIFRPNLVPHSNYGKVYPYNGYESSIQQLPDNNNPTIEKNANKEPSIDDMLTLMIEAISNDKDAFQYASVIDSDPRTGKQKHGGLISGYNYIDPTYYIHKAYSNPYGFTNTQNGFEGKGWRVIRPYGFYNYNRNYRYGYPYYGNRYYNNYRY